MPSPEMPPKEPAVKPNIKKSPAKAAPPSLQESLRKDFQRMARDGRSFIVNFLKNWEKFKDIVKNNFELGQRHLALGNYNDAVLRFRLVIWLDPKHMQAWYYLGATYMAKGDKKKAAEAFRKALELKPGDENAIYLLTVATGKLAERLGVPKRMPLDLAQEYFDSLAASYTEDQLYIKYEGHIETCNSVRSFATPGKVDHLVLDLGCGSGLCGPLIRDIANHMTGVDISGAMLSEAGTLLDNNGNKIYNALVKSDLTSFIADAPDNAYDIVLAANVFPFIGALDQIYAQVSRILRPRGLFAFCTDQLDAPDGFRFNAEEARFTYSRAYLESLGAGSGLKLLKCKDIKLYPDYAGWVCVFQKP